MSEWTLCSNDLAPGITSGSFFACCIWKMRWCSLFPTFGWEKYMNDWG